MIAQAEIGQIETLIDKDSDTIALEGDLSAALGMRVSVDHKWELKLDR